MGLTLSAKEKGVDAPGEDSLQYSTSRFGVIEVAEEQVVRIKGG